MTNRKQNSISTDAKNGVFRRLLMFLGVKSIITGKNQLVITVKQ